MPIWLSFLILLFGSVVAVTSLQNIIYELRTGELRPKLLFWSVPGWIANRAASPFSYWFGIALDGFRAAFFAALALVAAAFALQGQ